MKKLRIMACPGPPGGSMRSYTYRLGGKPNNPPSKWKMVKPSKTKQKEK